jgi:hypothetical protein
MTYLYSKLKNILYTDVVASQEKWGIFSPILHYVPPMPLIWLGVISLKYNPEVGHRYPQLPGDDSPHVGLSPQQWCHRRHRLYRDYLAAGAAGAAGVAAFASALAGALSSLLAGLATTAVAATGAAAGAAAGALAGSAAKAVVANRPAIRVAIVFMMFSFKFNSTQNFLCVHILTRQLTDRLTRLDKSVQNNRLRRAYYRLVILQSLSYSDTALCG